MHWERERFPAEIWIGSIEYANESPADRCDFGIVLQL